MTIGILSDSHGDAAATRRAVSLLISRGATTLFHCGDICGERVLDELVGHPCHFVWGNCDAISGSLRRYVQSVGLSWPEPGAEIEIAGRRIAMFHGHEPGFHDAVRSGRFHYVFCGHTHRFADERVNGCRLINPGALHRAAIKTVALLDLSKDSLEFLRLDSGEPIALSGRA